MELKDIKDGMIVETSESMYIKIGKKLFDSCCGYLDLDNYGDDFRFIDNNNTYDIIAVYKVGDKTMDMQDLFNKEWLDLVWERKKPPKLKDGMIVKFVNEEYFMVLEGYLYGIKGSHGCICIDISYDDNLLNKNLNDFNIVEVFDINNLRIDECGKLLWKRE